MKNRKMWTIVLAAAVAVVMLGSVITVAKAATLNTSDPAVPVRRLPAERGEHRLVPWQLN